MEGDLSKMQRKSLGPTQFRFTPDIGVVPLTESVCCGVCGDLMEEKRNCHGPRGFATSLKGEHDYYDQFLCSHRDTLWHRQVVALRLEIQTTASSKLAAMLQSEVEEILASRAATKADFE